ncbi:hypothetical protein X975_14609, partial [Stegodyphus mimosarum]
MENKTAVNLYGLRTVIWNASNCFPGCSITSQDMVTNSKLISSNLTGNCLFKGYTMDLIVKSYLLEVHFRTPISIF